MPCSISFLHACLKNVLLDLSTVAVTKDIVMKIAQLPTQLLLPHATMTLEINSFKTRVLAKQRFQMIAKKIKLANKNIIINAIKIIFLQAVLIKIISLLISIAKQLLTPLRLSSLLSQLLWFYYSESIQINKELRKKRIIY